MGSIVLALPYCWRKCICSTDFLSQDGVHDFQVARENGRLDPDAFESGTDHDGKRINPCRMRTATTTLRPKSAMVWCGLEVHQEAADEFFNEDAVIVRA